MGQRLMATGILMMTAAAAMAGASKPPPEPPYEAMTWPASLAQPPVHVLQMGRQRVILEETSLEQVRSWAGAGTLARASESPGSVSWLCYTVHGAGGPFRLWLLSDEPGPAEHAIGSVVAQQAAEAHPGPECPRLPLALQPLALDAGLWLGSPEADLQRLLGPPSHADGDWRAFDFEHRGSGNARCEGGYDLSSDLMVKIVDGVVVELNASQGTEC